MESKKVVISGASSGMGRALAKKLDSQGHIVLAIARREDALQSLAEKCQNLSYLAIDLSNSSGEEEVKAFLSSWGKLDLLVNNAGQLINRAFLETRVEDFQAMFNIHVGASVRLIQWAYPYLLKSNKPHVVNISSMGGVQGSSKFPGLSAYSTAKGALSILTECLAAELDDKVRINALALGAVQTEMLREAFPGYDAPLSADEMAEYIAHFALVGGKFYNGKILEVALGNP